MYESLILIDCDSTLGVERLAEELRRFYGKSDPNHRPVEICATGVALRLSWANYNFHINHSSEPHVIEESAEIAERFAAKHAERHRISMCRERLEVHADDDPEMNYFNDFLYIGEAAERMAKVYRFDQASAEFMS